LTRSLPASVNEKKTRFYRKKLSSINKQVLSARTTFAFKPVNSNIRHRSGNDNARRFANNSGDKTTITH